MKFLLDANIPQSAKEIFSSKHEVFHVQDIKLSTATDAVIIAWAQKQKAILVTRDLDFANILTFPSKKYSGIIVVRVPSYYIAKEIKRVLGQFLASAKDINFARSTIIVEEGRFRIKK